MTDVEKLAALWRALPREYQGRSLCHHPVVGYHAARASASHLLKKKDKLARQWLNEAVEALTAEGVISLSTIQQVMGEKVKPRQLSLL